MSGYYMQYLESLCRRRGWEYPMYNSQIDRKGFYTCSVCVNGREYQTDSAYESSLLAQENAAMRAFMVCQNFSMNGGYLAQNGIVQGLCASEGRAKRSQMHSGRCMSRRDSGNHSSSSSSTASSE